MGRFRSSKNMTNRTLRTVHATDCNKWHAILTSLTMRPRLPIESPIQSAEFRYSHGHSTSPIDTLSDDILLRIFTMNTKIDHTHVHRPAQDIRRYTQVCQRWRYLVLSAPVLWAASLDFGDPMIWLAETLRRTRRVPLHIVLPSPLTPPKDLSSLPLTYPFYSLIEFQAVQAVKYDDEKIERTLSLFPRARTFILRLVLQYDVEDEDNEEEPQLLLMRQRIHDLLSTEAPSLHTLSLNVPAPIWKTLPENPFSRFASVKSLGLCSTPFGTKSSIPGCWLEILRHMKQLEFLELDYHIYGGDDPSYAYSSVPVELPCLKSMRIRGDNKTCRVFLRQINFPPCNLELRVQDEDSDAHYQGLLKTIHMTLIHTNNTRRQHGFRIEFSATILSITCLPGLPGSNATFSLQYYTNINDHFRTTFHRLLSMMKSTCPNVTFLHIDILAFHTALKDNHLINLLSSFPKLEHLSIVGSRTLLRLLPLVNHESYMVNTLLIPNIRKLTLCNWTKDDRKRKYVMSTYRAREDFLLDVLRWRPQITHIGLVDCVDFPKHLFPEYIFS